MAANGLRGSPSIPKTLPPKKRNSTDNSNEAPAEPVFKTPSPFWNQNNFRRSRRTREPATVSYIDLQSAATYHPLWTDAGCASNQVLLHPLGDNGTFPSWGPYFEGGEQLLGVSNNNRNDLMSVHDFYGASSYWSYVPLAEQRDLLFKSYGWFSNQYKPKIIKPVPRSLVSHCTRSVLQKDFPRGQIDVGSVRGAQWDEKLQNESAKNDMRMRKRNYIREGMKQNSGQFAESGTDLSRHKYYSKFKGLSQMKAAKTEDLQHQRFPVIHQSCSSNEQLKSGTEVTLRDGHPLLARSEKSETQEQQELALPSSRLLTRFFEGSLIELDGGRLKRVEDLQLEDFECCTASCPELSLTRFTVKKITCSDKPGLICLEVEVEDNLHSKISLEVCEEYPFFVCGRGWSSCSPDRTANLCCLHCQQLHLGDMCLALTPVPVPPAEPTRPGTGVGDVGFLNRVEGAKPSKLRRRHSSAPELRNVQ
ncbi:uncharacterized protein LOC113539537 [Pangasianodon hypophthalmus]|uniref:uncharacterized protein LOC113539537 n=1 Tax=Pangasianodon hypophthalmus TaxID=310915 RepID=UPI0023077850|nr:uncharacterized protein LOC113539537 [Pangasianodon hypophthalmus]XP_034170004.2 uncharacterized protein LOC113539537 [Pangasianodon hypophthalmus]